VLTEWDEIDFDDDEEDEEDWVGSTADTTVLVKRKGEANWSFVNFMLSRHNGRWLIDSLNIN